MKNLETLLSQKPVYLNNWKTKSDVISNFDNIQILDGEYHDAACPHGNLKDLKRKERTTALLQKWKPINILFASYGQDNYSGDAFVLYEQEGKLFEVNASHCSCYGLEGQFDPEETTLEVLRHRLVKGTMGQDAYSGNEYAYELMLFLGI